MQATTAVTCVVLTVKGVVHLPDLDDSARDQQVFWAAWLCSFVAVPVEWRALDDAMAYADARATRAAAAAASSGSQLTESLLDSAEEGSAGGGTGGVDDAASAGTATTTSTSAGAEDKKKKKKDGTLGALLRLSLPDLPLLSFAFVFLVLYAVAAASVPHFTGNLVDAVAIDRDPEAFRRYSTWLLIAALCSGVFAGLRGSIFTVQMARLNTRIRRRLFDAILSQDIGFFDMNKTGDLSSRLNNDCSTVGLWPRCIQLTQSLKASGLAYTVMT